MTFKSYSKIAICTLLTTSLVSPQIAFANPTPGAASIFGSIFDSPGTNTNPGNTTTTQPNPRPTNSTGTAAPVQNTSATKMTPAKMPDIYTCPIFDNGPHRELLAAIDTLSAQIATTKECDGDPSFKGIQSNGETIKANVESLYNMMAITDPNQVNIADVEQSITAALGAVQNVGNILSNNSFLNSKCGSETMTAGKAALAFNDIINGLSPYALFAVSMNAALAPALPFVIGGIVATSGISVIGKMIENNSIDMSNPTYRKAVVINTCQFVKVSQKVRFMQLAQSGKIGQITNELQKSVKLYNAQFAKPTASLNSLLSVKNAHEKNFKQVNEQMKIDLEDIKAIESQLKINNDDLMVCTIANELVNWSRDGLSFPMSTLINLDTLTQSANRTQKLQAVTMKTHFESARRKVADSAAKISDSDEALKSCASAGRSWITGIRQTLTLTTNILGDSKNALEKSLDANQEYRNWKAQYVLIENQKNTVARVEKAMKQLAKDDSIIDRSELAQRMSQLKRGLFVNTSALKLGKSPVKAWIDHTKSMYDISMAAFKRNMGEITKASFSMTPAGKGHGVIYVGPTQFEDKAMQKRDRAIAENLSNLNLKTLPLGSRQHELACQQLENAWLDWSASIDHLGAIQYFCDMIEPVIDSQIDSAIRLACRGQETLAGNGYIGSLVKTTRQTLVSKGFQAKALLVSKKMNELKCALPSVNVMN